VNNGHATQVPNVEMDGWEVVYANDGTRWFGKVTGANGSHDLTMCPAWEVTAPLMGAVPVPQSDPRTGKLMGVQVQFPVHPGGNILYILNAKDSTPSVRIYRPAARVALSELSATKRGELRKMVAELLEEKKNADTSVPSNFGGVGEKVSLE
jgi:hypothetical protein